MMNQTSTQSTIWFYDKSHERIETAVWRRTTDFTVGNSETTIYGLTRSSEASVTHGSLQATRLQSREPFESLVLRQAF